MDTRAPFAIAMLLGCAAGQGGVQEPDADNPCTEANGFAVYLGAVDENMRRYQCDQKQSADAQAEAVRVHEEQTRAAAEQQEADAREQAKLQTQQELDDQIAAEARKKSEEEAASYADRMAYALAIDIKGCDEEWSADRARYDVLANYQSSPERDKAIRVIEGCRKAYARSIRKIGARVVGDMRREFALGLEDAFDEANPYRRGLLVARVDGSLLRVKMPGGFEGRARHSQGQLESWCEYGAANVFSKILLQNRHGTFSCIPDTWPGSTKAIVENALASSGAAKPLSSAAGAKVIPVADDADSSTATDGQSAAPP